MQHNPPGDPAGETDRDGGDEPLPPRREQLPLPRRDGQAHLEPQLREPGGSGSGTPFAAFGPNGPGNLATEPGPTACSGELAAAFRAATRRDPDGVEPPHSGPGRLRP